MATNYKGKLNVDTSIVDYLKSVGKDSSYNARKTLAQQLKIDNYKGTADQNISMLKMLKNGTSPTDAKKVDTKKPTSAPTAPKAPEAVSPVQQPTAPTVQPQSQPQPIPQSYSAPESLVAPSQYESPYSTQIDSILNSIINRQPFSYNAGTDPLYNQYKDKYSKAGNMAMRDTMGNASALTGGYGNTYSQGAGQQAYDAYMGQMNNVIPELYQAAYGRYQNEGTNQMNSLSMLQGMEQQAYGQHRDSVGDYQADRAFDYNKYIDEQSQSNWNSQFEHGVSQDALAQQNWQNQFDYGASQDKIAQSNWNKQFNHNVGQDNLAQSNWNKQFNHNVGQDAISQANYLKDYAIKQSQVNQSQANWEAEFQWDKEQTTLQNESKNSANKAKDYDKMIDDLLNETYVDEYGLTGNANSIEDVWDYLMTSDLSDAEIQKIINDNYKLRKYSEDKVGKGVSPAGRTYSYGYRDVK